MFDFVAAKLEVYCEVPLFDTSNIPDADYEYEKVTRMSGQTLVDFLDQLRSAEGRCILAAVNQGQIQSGEARLLTFLILISALRLMMKA